jgi:hypothetical protein
VLTQFLETQPRGVLALAAIRAIALCVVDAPTDVFPVVAFSDGSEFRWCGSMEYRI